MSSILVTQQDIEKAKKDIQKFLDDKVNGIEKDIQKKVQNLWTLNSRVKTLEMNLKSIEDKFKKEKVTRSVQSAIEHVHPMVDELVENVFIKPSENIRVSEEDDRRTKYAIILQRAWRIKRSRRIMRELVVQFFRSPHAKAMRQRNNVIREIEKTEETYVYGLMLAKNMYLQPLRSVATDKERFGITQEELDILFINLEQILTLHRIFLVHLKAEMEHWPVIHIGDVFVNQAPLFLFYIQYINLYQDSVNLLRAIRKREPKFEQFLKEQKHRPESKELSLDSLLVTPIQRLPRYNLLLRELIKVTDTNHLDYQKLQSANERIALINETINSQRAEYETMAMINLVHAKTHNEGEEENTEIQSLLIDPETKKPLRKYKGLEGPAKLAMASSEVTDETKVMNVGAVLFKNLLIVYRITKKKRGVVLILDFDRQSSMDVTLMPVSSVSQSNPLPKESIHLLVSDDTKNINDIYSIYFTEHMSVPAAKVHDTWKKVLEKLVVKSQIEKDTYREQKAKEKKKENIKKKTEEDENLPIQHRAMIKEYRKIFEIDRTVDETTLSIMEKYCSPEKKSLEKKFGSTIRIKDTKETFDESIINRFFSASLKAVTDNSEKKSVESQEKEKSSTKPSGYVSPFTEQPPTPSDNSNKFFKTDSYEKDEKTGSKAKNQKSEKTISTEKPKGYVSPYETGQKVDPERVNTMSRLFGSLLHISKKKDEEKK
jgi:hypothetical protein